MVSLIPDRIERSFAQIRPEQLVEQGIRLVLADLDNTLARYHQPDPDDAVLAWRDQLHEKGITLFVISNGRRPQRSQRFCTGLEIPYTSHAGKPHAAAFQAAMEQWGCSAEETVMLGDQIFTDILGAHNAGIRAIYIRAIALDSVFRKIRYGIEAPFRGLCRLRGDRI